MRGRVVRSILALPGTVLVLVPWGILWASRHLPFAPRLASASEIVFWLALLVAGLGFALSAWSIGLFERQGEGTLAPWDPPKTLVMRGPYRYVRNPMIIGVLMILVAEALFFHSWSIALWAGLFFVGNAVYFPLVEERDLEARFGADYRLYKANVRPWIPRLRPWERSKREVP